MHHHVARFSVQQVTCRPRAPAGEGKRAEKETLKKRLELRSNCQIIFCIRYLITTFMLWCIVLRLGVLSCRGKGHTRRIKAARGDCEGLAWYPCCPGSDMLLACCCNGGMTEGCWSTLDNTKPSQLDQHGIAVTPVVPSSLNTYSTLAARSSAAPLTHERGRFLLAMPAAVSARQRLLPLPSRHLITRLATCPAEEAQAPQLDRRKFALQDLCGTECADREQASGKDTWFICDCSFPHSKEADGGRWWPRVR